MSSNDKAKQKLMESMRMTKENSAKKIKETDKKKKINPQDNKAVVPQKTLTETRKASANTPNSAEDSYQSARRVWPD